MLFCFLQKMKTTFFLLCSLLPVIVFSFHGKHGKTIESKQIINNILKNSTISDYIYNLNFWLNKYPIYNTMVLKNDKKPKNFINLLLLK